MIARLVWRLSHGRWNPGWQGRLRQVEALARAPADELAAWHAARVAEHVAWATSGIPWFRERAPDATRLEDLPILTRRLLQEGREALRDPTRPPALLRLDASGGSTGEPVRFYTDANYDTATFVTEMLLQKWWGVRPWDRTAYVWGDDREVSQVPRKQRWTEALLGRLHLNAFQVDDERLAAFAARLRRFRPIVLQGYATALDLLAAHMAVDGGAPLRPRVVRSAAETLFPERRARIESVFGTTVRDVYGSRESAGLAAQCAHGGFHVMVHAKAIEIVDDAGQAVAPGVPGRVLVTDLSNRAFGLLRYENGDVAAWLPDGAPCPCGSAYPRLEKIHGRSSDFITTPSGLRIHGEWFTHLFYGRDDVRRFQLRQESLSRVVLLTEGSADQGAIAPLLDAVRGRLGPGVEVVWQGVERIETGPSGKHRFTVSNVPFATAGR